jgi:predicted nucleic acid-binding protein
VASTLLVDTDILIDAGRGDAHALSRLNQEAQLASLGVSTLTCLGLLVGCRNKREQQQTERLLQHLQIVPLDPAVSNSALDLVRQYRLSHGLLIPDALIAATALVGNVPLLIKNQRDFRFIAGLTLLPYP